MNNLRSFIKIQVSNLISFTFLRQLGSWRSKLEVFQILAPTSFLILEDATCQTFSRRSCIQLKKAYKLIHAWTQFCSFSSFFSNFFPKIKQKNMKTYKNENNYLLLPLLKTSQPRTSGTRNFVKPFLKSQTSETKKKRQQFHLEKIIVIPETILKAPSFEVREFELYEGFHFCFFKNLWISRKLKALEQL